MRYRRETGPRPGDSNGPSPLKAGRQESNKLISDALAFGRLWYAESDAVAKRDVDGKWEFGLELVI